MLNVSSDDVGRDLIPHGAGKIPVFPKLPAPKLILDLRVLLKNHTGTDALEHPHHPGNAVSRRKRQENMNMIGTDLQRLDHKSMTQCDLLEDLLHPHLKI